MKSVSFHQIPSAAWPFFAVKRQICPVDLGLNNWSHVERTFRIEVVSRFSRRNRTRSSERSSRKREEENIAGGQKNGSWSNQLELRIPEGRENGKVAYWPARL